MNKLVTLEQSRARMLDLYYAWFAGWMFATTAIARKRAGVICEDLVARIELVDAYIKREISA